MDLRIRDVPAHVHTALKSNAALERKTLNDYVREHLLRIANRKTKERAA